MIMEDSLLKRAMDRKSNTVRYRTVVRERGLSKVYLRTVLTQARGYLPFLMENHMSRILFS